MQKISSLALSLLAVTGVFADNTVTTVDQVTEGVTVRDDVDYVITNPEPFTTAGSVNITNTEHAVVIIKTIKPSKVISTWLKNVYINGEKAVNNKNCQVKMYSHGAIIFPYSSTFKPLTVYSEQNYGGESCNSFGLENTGGYMNTLSEAKLNNKIRSFKLKRGYMVTFSTGKEGRGYSRCFIADKADLEFATLPAVLDKTISSYRVFHWYNAKKAGLASDTRVEANDAVNSSWCYDWGTGVDRLPDVECVPNHIYEDWPSSSACGSVTYSCHMKTNNEPGNSADDRPQDVETILANWQNLMRTGLRLCSESSHDGSMGHLKAFIDSIDARGWRCDILDLHCYWPQGTFNNLNWYSSYYGNGRPIWISEWVWGASWNNNGAFAVSDRNDYQGNWNNNYNGTKPILDILNSNSKVERYAFWNSEANCSKIYLDGQLSKLGEYYANMDDDLGYDPKNEYIPKNPRMYDPGDLSLSYDKASKKVTLKWHEYNGELNQAMEIRIKKVGALSFSTLQSVENEDGEADYSIVVDGTAGDVFQIRVKDLDDKWRYSNEVTVVNENIEAGDEVPINADEVKYLGGNMLVNGDFLFGLNDWQNGKGENITAPNFMAVPEGGIKNSPYLQCFGNGASNSDAQAIRKIIDIESNTYYYISGAGANCDPKNQTISVSQNNTSPGITARLKFPETASWTNMSNTFKVDAQKYLWITLFNLQGKAQFDEIKVCRLFDTKEEAMANAVTYAKQRAELFKTINTEYPVLNTNIDELIASGADANAIEKAILEGIETIKATSQKETLEAIVTDDERNLPTDATNLYAINNTAIQGYDFSSVSAWNTKTGTYKQGDQKTTTQAGKKCWNAWWNIPVAGNENQTMGIEQMVTTDGTGKLYHGYYALECKATTQHYCETDQHAYLKHNESTIVSPALDMGRLDLPSFRDEEKWSTLATSYLYVNDADTLYVGFEGSKQGSVDGQYKPYGNPTASVDNRGGWWCATDFQFRFIPAMRYTADAFGCGTVCLPYDYTIPQGVNLFEIAGMLADSTYICLKPVTEAKAGIPYVYVTDANAPVEIFEDLTSEKATSAVTNSGGLRGQFFNTNGTAKYRKDCLILKDGAWTRIAESGVETTASYSGFIYQIKNVTKLDSWSGVMIKTSGLTSKTDNLESGAINLGIEGITIDKTSSDSRTYDIMGRRVSNNQKGIIIRDRKKTMNK